jgi:hypothetical protein
MIDLPRGPIEPHASHSEPDLMRFMPALSRRCCDLCRQEVVGAPFAYL